MTKQYSRPTKCPMDSCMHNIPTTGGCTLERVKQCPIEKQHQERERMYDKPVKGWLA